MKLGLDDYLNAYGVAAFRQLPKVDPSAITIVNAWDLVNDNTIPLPQWVWPGWFAKNAINMISGKYGHFKSWLMLIIAKGLAEGELFGTKFTPLRVLYVNLENPAHTVRDRLAKLGLTGPLPFDFWPQWVEPMPPPIPDERYFEADYDVIVFDSLVRFYPKGTDENSSNSVAPLMNFFRKLSVTKTVFILHHQGKDKENNGTKFRGSSDFGAGVDVMVHIHMEKLEP